MSNKFAPVLMALQETFASQGGTSRTWDATTLIVEKADEKGSIQWWVDAKKADTVLDDDAYELLLNEGLLVDEGKLRRIVKGRTARQALGVMFDELKKRARREEQSHSKLLVMQARTKQLERELKLAREQSAADTAMAVLIDRISEHFGGKATKPLPPNKLPRLTPQRGRALAGVPTLMLSDWHYGEVVNPDEVEGLNEYNIEIAQRRAQRVFGKTLELLFHHQSGQTYDAAVVPLAGDMPSGNIHDELRNTNEEPVFETVFQLMRELEKGLLQFAQNFPGVYVPCVVGNHGRIDKKPTAKNKVRDNYDWLLYKILEHSVTARLGDRCNVAFTVSPAADLAYSVYGTRYLLTHGDQFKSIGGVGGIFPGLLKTDYRKRKRSIQTGRGGYDYLLMGHWHQYGSVEGIIANGSLKGIDEYAYQMNLGYEPPRQALWMTHPEYGITYLSPVLAEEPETMDSAKHLPPVTCSMQTAAMRERAKAGK